MSVKMTVLQDRDRWFSKRSNYIGGSDAASIYASVEDAVRADAHEHYEKQEKYKRQNKFLQKQIKENRS